MTHDDAARLTTGADFWSTAAVAGVPSVTMADGPHGVRKQSGATDNLGIAQSDPATCFPPAVGLGQTWDAELAARVGAALAEEARAAGVDVLLGPGINIKRDPRCGRNFEYLSEDPLLSGVLGSAWVRGLQSRGVGASVKHFALNNQENDRMRSSSDADERTLHETYLRAFERVVREADPWTVMCSYNRINGVHASQNRWLLTDVLRSRWGYDGVVVSDWGAVVDPVAAIAAGLDLQMPARDAAGTEEIVAAVDDGRLTAFALEQAADRVAALARRASGSRSSFDVDPDRHRALAREAASAAIVLLQNTGDLLPLAPRGRIAVIGAFASEPRYQGGGSSHVNATRVDVPIDEIRAAAPEATVVFAAGFGLDADLDADLGGVDEEASRAEAVEVATGSDVAVVFLGLGEAQESEGYDRTDIDLPADQLRLLEAVLEVQPRTVVVLAHGGAVRLSGGVTKAPAILDGALLGQAAGGAISDVLFGRVNPSGRLAETIPVRLEDSPAWLSFPGENGHVQYGERIFVGYRWYDARELAVAFPFGHGLSYTRFDYSNLTVDVDADHLVVGLRVTNTGSRSGREIVQVYAGLARSRWARPPRELIGFTVVSVEPGAYVDVEILVPRVQLAVWDTRVSDWTVEGGAYDVSVGASSRDLRQSASVDLGGDEVRTPLTLESSLTEVFSHPVAAQLMMARLGEAGVGSQSDAGSDMGMNVGRMAESVPIGRFMGFEQLGITRAELLSILGQANGASEPAPSP